MTDIVVRILREEDWQTYREMRLGALQESPGSFLARYDDEVAQDEAFWRERMGRAQRFLAERDHQPVGVVSLTTDSEDEEAGDLFGLYVRPEARTTGVSWRLVQEAALEARRQGFHRLRYWVGTENARAIAFAANFGFRPAGGRRPARVSHAEFGDLEVAMTMSLQADTTIVPNPGRARARSVEGPLR